MTNHRLNPIIILNGPAGSGKTALCNQLISIDPTMFGIVSPSEVLREALVMLAYDGEFIHTDLTDPDVKNSQVPCVEQPFTNRDALLSLGACVRSWDPLFLAKRCAVTARNLLESGFPYILYDTARIPEDLDALLAEFPVNDMSLIRLERPDYTWESNPNDIGQWLSLPTPEGCIHLINNAEIEVLAGRILSMI